MTRIANLAANTFQLSHLFKTQARVEALQRQLTTEKLANDYAGLGGGSRNLIGMEVQSSSLARFERDNAVLSTQLDAMSVAIDGVTETVRTFRSVLAQSTSQPLSAQQAADLQAEAFRALQAVAGYLNADVDGRFLFSGGRVTTPPVTLPAASLAEFQAMYDGSKVVFPPTREADVGGRGSLNPAATGGITFSSSDTIQAAKPDAFAHLAVGSTIRIRDSATGNDGVYTVVSSNGSDAITIAGTLVAGSKSIPVTQTVANGMDASASIEIVTWYRGDNLDTAHRIDERRTLHLDLRANDPAFEKAMRAMAIIAQGGIGAPGGLDQHPERVEEALVLIQSAFERGAGAALPYGPEKESSLRDVAVELGFHRVVLSETTAAQKRLSGILETRTGTAENADKTETITRLLAEQRALEASYQALARIRQVSFADYLR